MRVYCFAFKLSTFAKLNYLKQNGVYLNSGYCLVSWGCRIHRLHLYRGVRPPQRVSWYDNRQSGGEVPVMLEFWGMESTPSLPWLQCPLWPGVVAPDRVLSMGQMELTCVLTLKWTAWNSTVLTFNCVNKNLYLYYAELF